MHDKIFYAQKRFVDLGTFPEQQFIAHLNLTSTVLFREVRFGTIVAADVSINSEASEIVGVVYFGTSSKLTMILMFSKRVKSQSTDSTEKENDLN